MTLGYRVHGSRKEFAIVVGGVLAKPEAIALLENENGFFGCDVEILGDEADGGLRDEHLAKDDVVGKRVKSC